MNILVTGGNGQLGRSLRDLSLGSDDNYIFTDIDSLDICDSDAVEAFINDYSIRLIVNCAAYTNVEQAEDNETMAEMINAGAVEILVSAAIKHDIHLFHISTDYVFDGKASSPLSELATTGPQSAYGRTKLHGEQVICGSQCKAIILRTAWLYSEYGHNFVKTMMNLLSNRQEINVVVDQIGSPTYARDLAQTIIDIISARNFEGREGIYNYTNEGVCSWYDFAKHIASMSGKNECKINPCSSFQYPTKAKRPAYSVLDKSKIKCTFGVKIPYWVDSLALCIKNNLKANVCE